MIVTHTKVNSNMHFFFVFFSGGGEYFELSRCIMFEIDKKTSGLYSLIWKLHKLGTFKSLERRFPLSRCNSYLRIFWKCANRIFVSHLKKNLPILKMCRFYTRVKFQNQFNVEHNLQNWQGYFFTYFNPFKPKVFGVKFSLREIGRIFLTKIRVLSFLKCLNNKI